LGALGCPKSFTKNFARGHKSSLEGRGWDLNPGARLHRPIGYQATSPRPPSVFLIYFLARILSCSFVNGDSSEKHFNA
jgi:hypothetical protein